MKRTLGGCLALAILSLGSGCRTGPAPRSSAIRAIWVTRFDYRDADDVRSILEACAGGGFNTVMFQVRGNGTAFYHSKLEPFAEELGGGDPTFDPLQLACAEARRLGLELHAWINVYPSWRGLEPPVDHGQLYLSHPEWHWFDSRGRRQPLVENFYTSLNPCLPEVRAYLLEIVRELVSNYDLDGLHLDYLRFVDDLVPEEVDYPRDARTLSLYRAAGGLEPDEDPVSWKRWRAEQVTELLRSIRELTREIAPGVLLSAAVGSEPDGPLGRHLRDSRRWAEEGLLDALFPMNYTNDAGQFARRAEAWSRVETRALIVTGIMLNPADRSLNTTLAQIRDSMGKSPHVCVFDYSYLFGPQGQPRRAALLAALRSLHNGPDS